MATPLLGLPDPLARLHGTAMRLGITGADGTVLGGTVLGGTVLDGTVLDGTGEASPWPDESTAAIVGFGEHIALNPALDDGLRTDVLAMALIVAAVMGECATDHPCAISAPGGFVLISAIRVPRPPPGPGQLATLLARKCGRDTASAAFEYTVPTLGAGISKMTSV